MYHKTKFISLFWLVASLPMHGMHTPINRNTSLSNNDASWYKFSKALPEELNKNIRAFFAKLIYKENPAICNDLESFLITKSHKHAIFYEKIPSKYILTYCEAPIAIGFRSEQFSSNYAPDPYRYQTITGKMLRTQIDGFTVCATIIHPYSFWLNSWIKYYVLNVYDQDNRCIIQHNCEKPVSSIEIKNNILTLSYNNWWWGRTTDSWNLNKKKEFELSANCFEFAMMYHFSKNIPKKDLIIFCNKTDPQ